jgi:DNA-binding NtrC family response regulator
LIARAIHGSGERRAKPFVAVNCGAMPENLIESILFGHERGSFTGATERHVGKFVEASGGTLFLDEVGELPPAAQVKLLRALQEGEVEPVGARKPVRVDVRLVSATNRDLIADVKQGRFREDLFYRLHVFPITVPPLRERPADIPPLARHFLARFAAEEGKRIRIVTPEALRLLGAFHWPGNIRQLENAVFRAVVLAEGDTVDIAEFPQITAQISAPAVNPANEEAAEPLVEYAQGEISPVAPFAAINRPPRRRFQPFPPRRWPCSTPAATCARSRSWRPRSSAMPSPIIADRCRRWRGGCKSAARHSIASSKRSASMTAAARPMAWKRPWPRCDSP